MIDWLNGVVVLMYSGFFKFLGPYYVLLITERRKVGMICGHAIYVVSKSKMIPIPHARMRSNSNNSKNEKRSYVHSTCKCKMYLILIRDRIFIVHLIRDLVLLVIVFLSLISFDFIWFHWYFCLAFWCDDGGISLSILIWLVLMIIINCGLFRSLQ